MKYTKRTINLTSAEWSVLSTIAERVLSIMEKEDGVWRDAEAPLIELTDEEMKLACEVAGSDTYEKSIGREDE